MSEYTIQVPPVLSAVGLHGSYDPDSDVSVMLDGVDSGDAPHNQARDWLAKAFNKLSPIAAARPMACTVFGNVANTCLGYATGKVVACMSVPFLLPSLAGEDEFLSDWRDLSNTYAIIDSVLLTLQGIALSLELASDSTRQDKLATLRLWSGMLASQLGVGVGALTGGGGASLALRAMASMASVDAGPEAHMWARFAGGLGGAILGGSAGFAWALRGYKT